MINPQHSSLKIFELGIADYQAIWQEMQAFTNTRTKNTQDQLWLVQHPPVFTLGQQGERNQVIKRTNIPIIQTDRGGHVTYHGPGQLLAYPLLNLRHYGLTVRTLVTTLETLLIELLKQFDILAYARVDAPGVYVNHKKIASLGLRIRKGCSYHGLALNVNMDLTPFNWINPCGMAGMQMTQIRDFVPGIKIEDTIEVLKKLFIKKFC